MQSLWRVGGLVVLLLSGCGPTLPGESSDGARAQDGAVAAADAPGGGDPVDAAGGRRDAGASDAGRRDAGRADAGRADAARMDAGHADAARPVDAPRTPDAAAACGPATCAMGCCMGNTCVAGTDVQACGTGGGLCTQCTAQQDCVASGAQRICAGRNYAVKLASASVLSMNGSGAVWDTPTDSGCLDCVLGCCPPDLYATGSVGALTIPRVEATDTANATWNLALGNASDVQLVGATVNVTIVDADNIPADDTIGTCTSTVRATDLAAGQLRLTSAGSTCGGQVTEVVLQFTRL